MRRKPFEIEITKSGKIRCIYRDDIHPTIRRMGKVSIDRASHVEWEMDKHTGACGWTVRSAHSPAYVYLRRSAVDGKPEVTTNGNGLPAFFATREEALAEEVGHFWQLLPEDGK